MHEHQFPTVSQSTIINLGDAFFCSDTSKSHSSWYRLVNQPPCHLLRHGPYDVTILDNASLGWPIVRHRMVHLAATNGTHTQQCLSSHWTSRCSYYFCYAFYIGFPNPPNHYSAMLHPPLFIISFILSAPLSRSDLIGHASVQHLIPPITALHKTQGPFPCDDQAHTVLGPISTALDTPGVL